MFKVSIPAYESVSGAREIAQRVKGLIAEPSDRVEISRGFIWVEIYTKAPERVIKDLQEEGFLD